MSEVKRYVTTCDCMSEASWGDYVRHADYDALAAKFNDPEYPPKHSRRLIEQLRTERDAALAELAEEQALRERMSELLSQSAVALRGPEPPLTRYSYADIPSRVKAVVEELAALKGGQEAVAMIRYARGVPGFENEMPHVVSCNDLPDGLYPVYLAPPAQANWRDHSVNIAKGEKCPQTIETLQAAWERDQELLLDQRAEIAKLKEKLNQARQKQPAQASAWVPEGLRELAKAVATLDKVPRTSGHALPKPEQIRAEGAVIRAARAMLAASDGKEGE